MRSVRGIVLWLGLLGLLMSGCARIPTSGPVDPAAGPSRLPDVSVEVAAEPPLRGAAPRTVVEGFLQAMANYQQGYSVARLYLATDVRDSWRPENGITVYEDGYGVTSTPESASLEAPLRGFVGQDGAFRPSVDTLTHDFVMTRDTDGEWRIANPPNGLLVSRYLFEKFYRPANIYFYDPTWTTVVPDPIFVPVGNWTPTALLQALLRGPTEWLNPAVATAIPSQTRLNVQAAIIDADGVVEVSLNESVAALADEQRSRMAGQITWTLSQLDGVTGVRFLLNGAPYAVPEAEDGVVRIHAFSWLDPTPGLRTVQLFGATDEGFVTVVDSPQGADLRSVPGALGSVPGVTSLDVSPTGERIAWVSEGEHTLRAGLLDETLPPPVLQAQHILRPQFVRSQDVELWTIADDEAEGQVAYRLIGDRVEPIRLEAFAGTRVEAYRIAPDGTRLAAVRRTGEGRLEVGVARINRTNPAVVVDGWREVSLEEPGYPRPDQIPDVGWLTPTNLIVLASGDGRQTVRPYRLDVYAASVTEIGQPDNWQSFAVATSPRSENGRAVVVGHNGSWRFEDDYRWPLLVRGLNAVAYAG
ncbi:LpqB family beta-propeller domain-containing protein [Granulicoccus sp. GXG6511]|uniref:LpqB family beta-propeller domain-containing protein n=1 Tax=Granulicoccus sp. GXG6511 TaxID=3381351 RepID=UPI003D7D421C